MLQWRTDMVLLVFMNDDPIITAPPVIPEGIPESAVSFGGAPPCRNLLARIAQMRISAGDLNDYEFTELLHKENLPAEAGFGFLSFSEGYATFSVPEQHAQDWYTGTGWISPVKEDLADRLAAKYRLCLYEPINNVPRCLLPLKEGAAIQHHIEWHSPRGRVIVAHPQYLKICLQAFNDVNIDRNISVLGELSLLYNNI